MTTPPAVFCEPTATTPTIADEAPRSRRSLLRLAGAAAAGTAAATLLSSQRAAAAGSLTLDSIANTATSPTGLQVNGSAIPYGIAVTDNGLGAVPAEVGRPAVLGHAALDAFNQGVAGLLDSSSTSSANAAVKGYASFYGTGVVGIAEVDEGVVGRSRGATTRSIGVLGQGRIGVAGSGAEYGVSAYSEDPGGVAVLAGGKCGALRLTTWTGTPTERVEAHQANVLDNDDDHNLWWSYEAGTPGKWRKIAGPGTAGAFHPITPTRVYDSRKAGSTPTGVLATAAGPRTVSIKDGRDIGTGNVNAANVVAAQATAIAVNLTVTATAGSGYLTINPGGTTTVSASTINWSAPGLSLANGVILTINPATREVTVVPGGAGASTHFILDVTGYWR